MYNPNNYLAQVVWTFFVCQQNCFLLFYSDLAEFELPTLFADIRRPNWKSAQGPTLWIELQTARVSSIFFYFNN